MKSHEEFALKFGRHIVQKEWEAAHSMLSVELKSSVSSTDIEQKVREMTDYSDDEISEAEVVMEMEDWSEKKDNDTGWVYLSLSGSTLSEAVTVVVTKENSHLAIWSLEWGRP